LHLQDSREPSLRALSTSDPSPFPLLVHTSFSPLSLTSPVPLVRQFGTRINPDGRRLLPKLGSAWVFSAVQPELGSRHGVAQSVPTLWLRCAGVGRVAVAVAKIMRRGFGSSGFCSSGFCSREFGGRVIGSRGIGSGRFGSGGFGSGSRGLGSS
jgi:hypothetical protein